MQKCLLRPTPADHSQAPADKRRRGAPARGKPARAPVGGRPLSGAPIAQRARKNGLDGTDAALPTWPPLKLRQRYGLGVERRALSDHPDPSRGGAPEELPAARTAASGDRWAPPNEGAAPGCTSVERSWPPSGLGVREQPGCAGKPTGAPATAEDQLTTSSAADAGTRSSRCCGRRARRVQRAWAKIHLRPSLEVSGALAAGEDSGVACGAHSHGRMPRLP